ncbi:hypothetical protein O181_079115 [Austropuccinia psidii MF-1]|uniref:Uncharacterized protein n=1 Tax=Austropuccinia psidii MF-1 TaxID=1389203 RepID=A0A9Q3FE64_9BASI|nr:hypothetical protein [Austropuccinia psidii MF-1]
MSKPYNHQNCDSQLTHPRLGHNLQAHDNHNTDDWNHTYLFPNLNTIAYSHHMPSMEINSTIQSYGQMDPERSRDSRLTYSNWVNPYSKSMVNSRPSEFRKGKFHDQGENSYNPQ